MSSCVKSKILLNHLMAIFLLYTITTLSLSGLIYSNFFLKCILPTGICNLFKILEFFFLKKGKLHSKSFTLWVCLFPVLHTFT